jgi:hypothetical protein
MEVLPRELHALDASVTPFYGVRECVRSSHPERVHRIIEPLTIEGSEPGSAVRLCGGEVAFVGRGAITLGEPLSLGEQPLKDLDIGGLEALRQMLAGGMQIHQSGLLERSRKQEANSPAEQHTKEGDVPE